MNNTPINKHIDGDVSDINDTGGKGVIIGDGNVTNENVLGTRRQRLRNALKTTNSTIPTIPSTSITSIPTTRSQALTSSTNSATTVTSISNSPNVRITGKKITSEHMKKVLKPLKTISSVAKKSNELHNLFADNLNIIQPLTDSITSLRSSVISNSGVSTCTEQTDQSEEDLKVLRQRYKSEKLNNSLLSGGK